MRVLVLGGTGEGRALAERLALVPGVEVVSSLAGRIAAPRLPVGQVRVGGFAGIDGLSGYLSTERVDAVIDATHPFAARMTAHAATACARHSVPLVVLRRPGWTARSRDDWRRVPDVDAAARAVAASPPGAVLLTVGRRDPAAFADDDTHHFVIRCIDPPDRVSALPPRHTLVLDRGPFTTDGDLDLMRRHGVELLVTKDSGGTATVTKLVAARELGLPVVMVDRPPLPPGPPVVQSVMDAEIWLTRTLPP